MQTRYYDPEVGRFINADAFKYLGADGPIHGMNLYAYCGNNPVGCSDPSGTFAIALTALCIWKAIKIALAVTGAIAGACILAGAAYAGSGALVATIAPSQIDSINDINLNYVGISQDEDKRDREFFTFEYGGDTYRAGYCETNGWRIYNSHQIKNESDLKLICDALARERSVLSRDGNGFRSAENLAYEWQQHNIAYHWIQPLGWMREDIADAASRAGTVDLDPQSRDEGKNAIDLILMRLFS